jgi:hypothetical protein
MCGLDMRKLCYWVSDDRQQTMDDERQVMVRAHVALGAWAKANSVSRLYRESILTLKMQT